MIMHAPSFNTDEVCKTYSRKDGVEVKYVCTTDLTASDVPVDVFYREEAHPEFGNRYFGLYYDHVRDNVMICNADIVEELDFGCIRDNEGNLYYSASHHDCIFMDGSMIDGGRVYTRSSGTVENYKVLDGEMIPEDSYKHRIKKRYYQ